MRSRVLGLVAITLTLGLSGIVGTAQTQTAPAAQTRPAAVAPTSTAKSKVPRTPWGDPDLQGTWDYRTITPLERPREFGTREFYTEAEKKALEDRAGRRMDSRPRRLHRGLITRSGGPIPGGSFRTVIAHRWSWIRRMVVFRALTAEGRARQAGAPNRNNAVNASWLDRGDQERCITYGLPSASLPTLYNNNIQIVQAPGTASSCTR